LEQLYGTDIDTILAAARNPNPTPNTPPDTPPAPEDPDDKPVTMKQLRAEQERMAHEAQKHQTEQQRVASENSARQDRETWRTSALKELFPPDEGGKQPPVVRSFGRDLEAELADVMLKDATESLPGHLRNDRDALYRAVWGTRPTDEQKARALEAVKTAATDFITYARSQQANKQLNTPPTTLSSGAGGRPARKPAEEMSKKEYIDALAAEL
jgi:hypothetical protein